MNQDVFRFVDSIRTRAWLGMVHAIDSALIEATRRSDQLGAQLRDAEHIEFMRFLVAARAYLMGEGLERPAALEDAHFLQLKPLCESLVLRGRFAESCLRLFDGCVDVSAPAAPQPIVYGRVILSG